MGKIKDLVAKLKAATGSTEIEEVGKDFLQSIKNVEDKVTSAREVVDAYREKMHALEQEQDDAKRDEIAARASKIIDVIDTHFGAERAELIKVTEKALKAKGAHPLLIKRLDALKKKG